MHWKLQKTMDLLSLPSSESPLPAKKERSRKLNFAVGASQFAALHSSLPISDANGRNAIRVVLYEDAAKKQLQEFLAALRGCQLMSQTCSALSAILDSVESNLLHHLLTSGNGHSDIDSVLTHFKDAFDWLEADRSGCIVPHEGVDIEYDSACRIVKEIEFNLARHLKEQRKLLGDLSTLTSILTARSKVACGLTEKEQIHNINAADVEDQLVVMDYKA